MTGPDNDWVSTLAPIPDPRSPAGQKAKAKSLRDFAKLAHYSAAITSEALSGKQRKVPSEAVVVGICNTCGADESLRARLLDLRTQAFAARGHPRA